MRRCGACPSGPGDAGVPTKRAEDKSRWRLIASNGRVTASSNESFGSRADAVRAAETVKAEALEAPVSSTPGIGPKEVIARLIRREEARRIKVAAGEVQRTEVRRAMARTRVGTSPRRIRVVGPRRLA